jgi:hypothetical protein
MSRKFFSTLAVAAVLGWTVAANGIPAGDLNTTIQNGDEGIVVPPGGDPVGIVISPAVYTPGSLILPADEPGGVVVSPDVTPVGDGDQPPPNVVVPLGPVSMAPAPLGDDFQYNPPTGDGTGDDVPDPSAGPVTGDGPGDDGTGGAGGGDGDGGAPQDIAPSGPNLSILELRPDFLYNSSQRLFEAQSSNSAGQKRLGIAPGLSNTGPRYVPLGEF